MCEYSMPYIIMAYPWIAAAMIVLALIILLLPYEVMYLLQTDRKYYQWRALLWSWERGPTYTRLRLSGLLKIQRILLKLIQWLWWQYRERLWAGVHEMLKRWTV